MSTQEVSDSFEDRSQLAWIAVDWGTTHLRAWAMNAANTVLASASSDKGMGTLEPHEFEPALIALVSGWLGGRDAVPVLACGMVGARQGWVEADYQAVPTRPLVSHLFQPVKPVDTRVQIHIVPGLKQDAPPDVMRGEETQIAGLLSTTPHFNGMVCLPGTHTKWVHVAEGKVLRFGSYMTGEIFSLLERRSVLRHSVDGQAIDRPVFEATLVKVFEDPELAVSGLFSLRADDLLNSADAFCLRSQLSGLLLGAEVHAATKNVATCDIALIGAPDLTQLYDHALVLKGFAPYQLNAEDLTISGLIAAKALLEGGRHDAKPDCDLARHRAQGCG